MITIVFSKRELSLMLLVINRHYITFNKYAKLYKLKQLIFVLSKYADFFVNSDKFNFLKIIKSFSN